ncbi:putative auxin efflux carrier component 3-like [Capsicum annuum]|nr:putative auxin efflux carrier component 3-like [Capsicum annuum]
MYEGWNEILNIQKFQRIVSYTGFHCFIAVVTYPYPNNTTRAGYSRDDQFYASYPAGIERLTDTTKLYKEALGNVFEEGEWGLVEWCILAKHFERQGKLPYVIMLNTWRTSLLWTTRWKWIAGG